MGKQGIDFARACADVRDRRSRLRMRTWLVMAFLSQFMVGMALAQPKTNRLRRPIPPQSVLVQATKTDAAALLKEVARAKKADQRSALARKLLAGVEKQSNPVVRYIQLESARLLAVKAKDPTLALQAADDMSQWYQVDRFKLSAQTLEQLVAAHKQRAFIEEMINKAMDLTRVAIEQQHFDGGKALVKFGLAAARKLGSTDLQRMVQDVAQQLAIVEKAEANAILN